MTSYEVLTLLIQLGVVVGTLWLAFLASQKMLPAEKEYITGSIDFTISAMREASGIQILLYNSGKKSAKINSNNCITVEVHENNFSFVIPDRLKHMMDSSVLHPKTTLPYLLDKKDGPEEQRFINDLYKCFLEDNKTSKFFIYTDKAHVVELLITMENRKRLTDEENTYRAKYNNDFREKYLHIRKPIDPLPTIDWNT